MFISRGQNGEHTGCQIDTIVTSCIRVMPLRRAVTSHTANRFIGEYRNFSESHRFSVVRGCGVRENGAMQNDALQQILMTASRERSERTVLRIIVDGLGEQPHVALARIWLLRPGDICATCRMRAECPDQARCLHLAASSGRSLAAPGADWTRLDGDFRRFPVGVRKVGQIAATGVSLFVANTAEQSEWIARPEWAAGEHIRSFAGQPLVFGGETLGVIAVFSRRTERNRYSLAPPVRQSGRHHPRQCASV
jgi:hypothetical protein